MLRPRKHAVPGHVGCGHCRAGMHMQVESWVSFEGSINLVTGAAVQVREKIRRAQAAAQVGAAYPTSVAVPAGVHELGHLHEL